MRAKLGWGSDNEAREAVISHFAAGGEARTAYPGRLRYWWMLIVRPAQAEWREGLITGADVGPTMERWIGSGVYKDRSS